ncbi:MAG: GIY-YIG nuclease family protein [Bacteroidetes bacterium]|nr:GIY-YIG nuclease family protein [Bacteroidota bacterium]
MDNHLSQDDCPFWYVYVLECSDGHRDTGFTNDLDRAIFDHNSGICHTTRDRGPVNILSYVAFSDMHNAIHFEKYLRKAPGRKFLNTKMLNSLSRKRDNKSRR